MQLEISHLVVFYCMSSLGSLQRRPKQSEMEEQTVVSAHLSLIMLQQEVFVSSISCCLSEGPTLCGLSQSSNSFSFPQSLTSHHCWFVCALCFFCNRNHSLLGEFTFNRKQEQGENLWFLSFY
ncbi:hypothetical protein AMECASPLE_037472 [Ameca splendens]|uniref:Uncharacterized protein n=1 Tax=Ameca splendens TaxID=208324 RepID=A0ABV0Y7Z8_9TELE